MRKTSPPFTFSDQVRTRVPVEILPRLLDSWLYDGEAAQHSERTLHNRRERVGRLIAFLQSHGHATCGVEELREFFVYLRRSRPGEPIKPSTVHSYYSSIRTLFNFAIAEGKLDQNPITRVSVPVNRPDQIQPFTQAQIMALLTQARKEALSSRNEAILLLLLDTGIRASELCSLQVEDLDLESGSITVEGKGGKRRTIPICRRTRRQIFTYLSERQIAPDEALFLSTRGSEAGAGLTREALGNLVRTLGRRAGVSGARCSPHTFRHTFAIEFLRNGGNVFTLKTILGHESLAMTNRYVAIAQADMANAHRQYSPVAKLGKGR